MVPTGAVGTDTRPKGLKGKYKAVDPRMKKDMRGMVSGGAMRGSIAMGCTCACMRNFFYVVLRRAALRCAESRGEETRQVDEEPQQEAGCVQVAPGVNAERAVLGSTVHCAGGLRTLNFPRVLRPWGGGGEIHASEQCAHKTHH